jgi:RNA polymerase sigma-70 factor, ECF subfamily
MQTEHGAATNLLARARGGDMTAFERLVEPLYDPAYRLAAVMLDDRGAAEDAVQEALFRAWRKIDRFRYGDDLKPWLLSLVANQCREMRRRRWWSVGKVADLPLVATADDADRVVVDAQLRQALSTLGHDERLVLILRYYFDLSFDEIAKTLNLTPAAARKRAGRALRRLRAELEDDEC